MRQIDAKARSIDDLLSKQSYQIDYYQREYRWEEKQVDELVDDLVTAFLDDYEKDHTTQKVAGYGNYFLGPIIVSQRGSDRFIVDGQQRLTTLTLLLIFLENIKPVDMQPNLRDLIYFDDFGSKTFNLKVDEREPALLTLLDGDIPAISDSTSESVINLIERYQDVADRFPYRNSVSHPDPLPGGREITEASLQHFLYWITSKVFLVEIIASSDEDAYTIFETMNDRGLSLTPTDMLKGYLLANIDDADNRRIKANETWRSVVGKLHEDDREASADFFKSWLRSQYARNIRVGSTGKVQDYDFDRIGSEFHRWVRDESTRLGLTSSDAFASFADISMPFFAGQYGLIGEASLKAMPGLEHIRYNASRGFTLQPMLLLAPIRFGDSPDLIRQKLRLVAMYLDIVLARREWNQRRIGQSSMRVSVFNDMLKYRDCTDPADLARQLFALLENPDEDFDSFTVGLNMMNGGSVKRALARLTEYVEKGTGGTVDYDTLMAPGNKYEIEHIWADFPERHRDEFSHKNEFRDYRNRLGGLLLVPKSFNASYGAKPYAVKYKHYFGQNALAKSLHENAYVHHPAFANFRQRTGLNFQAHTDFKKDDLDARQELYRDIAKQIWDPKRLLNEVGE